MIDVVALPDSVSSADLAAIAAPLQGVPDRFQAYFGDAADEIAAEIDEFADWRSLTTVAVEGGSVIGWVIVDNDDEVGRVWWWGPVVSPEYEWTVVAGLLLDAAEARLAGRFEQFEFAVDERHVMAIGLATARGFRRDVGSVLLRLQGAVTPTDLPSVSVGPLSTDHADAVARLHDEVFPGSHMTGRQLVTTDADVLIAAQDGSETVGYLRAEVQPGGEGYIDFVGVGSRHRGRGIGRALVDRAVADLRATGVPAVSLTVREDNDAARALYQRLGFDGERILVPLRLGFHL